MDKILPALQLKEGPATLQQDTHEQMTEWRYPVLARLLGPVMLHLSKDDTVRSFVSKTSY